MSRYLLKAVDTYRVATVEDVETLHQGFIPHTLCKEFIFAERKIFVNFSIQRVIILLKRK